MKTYYSERGILNTDMVILILLILGVLWFSFSLQEHVQADKLTCSSFLSQKAAQETFNSNSKKYKSLDRDKDGTACENLP